MSRLLDSESYSIPKKVTELESRATPPRGKRIIHSDNECTLRTLFPCAQ